MMKVLFMALALCLSLSSCTKDDPAPEPQIYDENEQTEKPETGNEEPSQPAEANSTPLYLDTRARGMVSQSNTMAWNLLEHSLKAGENTLLSPLSLSACLAMLDNAADSETEQEIRQFIGFGDYSQEEFNAFFQMVLNGLQEVDTSVKFTSANSFWHRDDLTPYQPFQTSLRDYYNAEMYGVDFLAPETLNRVNQWCEQKTNGLIKNFLQRIDPSTAALLFNAIYFLGAWTEPFDKELTTEDDFCLADNSREKADFMHRQALECAYEDKTVQILRLPFGAYSLYKMVFILPREGHTLAEAAAKAQKVMGNRAEKQSAKWRMYDVTMSVPKFEIETKGSLINILQDMGLQKAFCTAYPYMFEQGDEIVLSNIMQGCKLTIDEEKVEAAAVTMTEMVATAVPGESPTYPTMIINLNRPFLFALTEDCTDAILFIGALNTTK